MSDRADELVQRARDEYGDLVERVLVWPDGGVDAILIGGSRVMFRPNGRRFVVNLDGAVDRPTTATRTQRLIAALRGRFRRIREGDKD